jgi:hypothetical protein
MASNPYSGRMTSGDARRVEGRGGRAGSSRALASSSSRIVSKRQKLDHPEENISKFFPREVTRPRPAQIDPSTPLYSHPRLAITDAIIIDGEDDTPATNDDPHEPIVLGTSSPDPMDLINSEHSYAFDHNKPSPMHEFSSVLEEKRKSPQDGASTLRLRKAVKQDEARKWESASRPDGDGDDVSTSESTARAEVSSGRSNVMSKVALFEDFEDRRDNTPHFNLRTFTGQSRKSMMKPKQVGLLSYSVAPATK